MLLDKPGENLWCKHAEMMLVDLYFITTGYLLSRFFGFLLFLFLWDCLPNQCVGIFAMFFIMSYSCCGFV